MITSSMTLNQLAPSEQTIGFIGAGNMASAIARGLIKSGHRPNRVIMSNPGTAKLEKLQTELGIKTTTNNQEVCNQSQIVLLTIKPQQFEPVLIPLNFTSVNCVISVAAGVTLAKVESLIGTSPLTVRSMPNTPATNLVGATGVFAAPTYRASLTSLVDYIFGAIGRYVWVEDEKLMNTVTAISGSGPAYFFQFVESLIVAGIANGLDEETARTLVVQTALGAATMMSNQTDKPVAELRKAVTSPGGTTAAALQSFTDNDFQTIISRAVDASVARGTELSNE